MLDFQPIDISHASRLREAFAAQPYRACDYTLGAVWQWRNWFSSRVAFCGPSAVLTADYGAWETWYMFPCGGEGADILAALKRIEEDAGERGQPLRFCAVPEEALSILRQVYGERLRYTENRDWADYLYNKEDLRLYPGRRYHRQKNHLSRFLREHPFSVFVPVTEETLPEARAFLAAYAETAKQDQPIEREELERSKELLEMALPFGLKAGFLRADEGHVCALSIGETVGDTLYVHVEKANIAYNGAYQAIVSAFIQYAAGPGVLWCNREDDSGEEGLRQSKEAYHPVRLIDKYWVTVE